MTDMMYAVGQMLKQSRDLALRATSEEERHFFDREAYMWQRELINHNINPASIDSLEFQVNHGFYDEYPLLKQQAQQILASGSNLT